MGNNILNSLIKNKLRKYVRIFKENKVKYSIYLVLSIFLISTVLNFIKIAIDNYFTFVTLAMYIYCIAKVFQEIPIMTIDYQLFEFKILKLWQFKILIILKSTVLSIIILIFAITFKDMFTQVQLKQFILLILINVLVNIICFFKTQIANKNLLVIVTVLTLFLIYYMNFITLTIISLGVLIYIFTVMKFIKYDELFPYYHSMAYLFQGLSENNIDTISIGQTKFVKQKIKNQPSLIEKYYNLDFGFEFYKEISRAISNYKKIINISLFNFIITSLLIIYKVPLWLGGIVMFIIVFMVDTILTNLNKFEYINKVKGFYLPYTLKDALIKKYLPQLCIILIPFISSILILKYINLTTFIICILIIPIKNILYNFSSKLNIKLIAYVLESIILISICIDCGIIF